MCFFPTKAQNQANIAIASDFFIYLFLRTFSGLKCKCCEKHELITFRENFCVTNSHKIVAILGLHFIKLHL